MSSEPTSSNGIRPRSGKVRVLIVDDSAVVRQVLSRELARDPNIEVVGTAADPFIARERIVELQPDVITLDVEMPRMDGVTFLRHLMKAKPMPVIVLSSLTQAGTQTAIDALAAGAVDVMGKPGSSFSVDDVAPALARRIQSAARAQVRATAGPSTVLGPALVTTNKIFAIGASTGGVQALTEVLTAFPKNAPGTLVVQHMPAKFTASFAQRLNSMSQMEVREAQDGDSLIPGRVLIAPGGLHMLLRRSGATYVVEIKDGPPVRHQKPSVEVMFQSVAQAAGPNAIGAILTGMGDDGALGLLAMKNAGARTVAQDEATSVVYGMPAAAVKCGAVERSVPLAAVARTMMELVNELSSRT
jgi:two-component system, chemotaxis family, protein-glutamate methylesterase/glutaminase